MYEDMNPDTCIAERIAYVRSRIRIACEKSGRRPEDVTLIAVSKTKPFSDIEEAMAAGMIHFGENYVQELMQKTEFPGNIEGMNRIQWHMIGHLQRNKVKYLIGRTALIHSVDSVPLAAQIEKEAAGKNQVVRILLEVNIAREKSKWGFDPDSVYAVFREIQEFPHIRALGLMTSAPYTENPETNRIYFRELNNCARQLAKEQLLWVSDPDFPGPVLSMGMSGDYEVAIEEGATMVRVGTGIFGRRS